MEMKVKDISINYENITYIEEENELLMNPNEK